MLVLPESPSAVRVMMRSKSVSICNHSRAILVHSGRNRAFRSGYPNLMPSHGGLVEPKGSIHTPLKVIDVGTTGKLVGSACYDKQHVCVYLQPFSP